MNRRTFIGAAVSGTLTGCLGMTGSQSGKREWATDSAEPQPEPASRTPSTPRSSTSNPTGQNQPPDSQTVPLGETVILAEVTDVTVSVYGYTKQLLFNDGRSFVAEDGTVYLLVHVVAAGHDGNTRGLFPGPDTFQLLGSGRTFYPKTEFIDWVDFGMLTHPTSERLYVGGAAGSSRRSNGMVVYQLPTDFSGEVAVEMILPKVSGPAAAWQGQLGRFRDR